MSAGGVCSRTANSSIEQESCRSSPQCRKQNLVMAGNQSVALFLNGIHSLTSDLSLRYADDTVPDCLCFPGAGAGAPAPGAFRCDHPSDGRVDRVATAGSVSVGQCVPLSATRSRSDLWAGLCGSSSGDGHPTGAFGPARAV